MADGFIWPFLSGIAVAAVVGAFAWSLRKRQEHGGWRRLMTGKWRKRRRQRAERRKRDEQIAREVPFWSSQRNVIRHAARLRQMEMRPAGTYWHGEWRRERSEMTKALKEYLRLGTVEPHHGKRLLISNSEGHFIIYLWEAQIMRSGKRAFVSVYWSPYPLDGRSGVGDPSRDKLVFRRWLVDDQAEAIGLKLDARCAATE